MVMDEVGAKQFSELGRDESRVARAGLGALPDVGGFPPAVVVEGVALNEGDQFAGMFAEVRH